MTAMETYPSCGRFGGSRCLWAMCLAAVQHGALCRSKDRSDKDVRGMVWAGPILLRQGIGLDETSGGSFPSHCYRMCWCDGLTSQGE